MSEPGGLMAELRGPTDEMDTWPLWDDARAERELRDYVEARGFERTDFHIVRAGIGAAAMCGLVGGPSPYLLVDFIERWPSLAERVVLCRGCVSAYVGGA